MSTIKQLSKRKSKVNVEKRMPSAQPPASSAGSNSGEMAKRKEASGLTGKMRRTLKRMGGRFPKELPAQDDNVHHSGSSVDTIIPRLSEDLEIEREMHEIREVNGSRQPLASDNRSSKLYRQNGSANYERCKEHNGSNVCGRTEYGGQSVAMANGVYATAESRTDDERSNERVSQNDEYSTTDDSDSVRERKATSSNGLAMFEKQGARPKTGLYRKKSSPVGKNIEFGVTAVVLNVQANRSGEDGKGNDVVADFQLRVGGLSNEEDSETSSNPVPLPGKGSMRNDISVKLSPGFGGNLNSDVTLNCSVNVHCHISGVDAVTEEAEDGQDAADSVEGVVKNEEGWSSQRSKFMSSAELEPLVIQMGQQPDNEVPSNPRTPHIAEVVMRDSLSNMESDSADKVQKGEGESLGRDGRPQPKGHKDASVPPNSAKEVAEKMKRKFEEVVLLPKDSQIIDVVTGHRDPTYDEDDMRLEYSLPRSVSDGAAILSSYRNDESFKDKALLGPAVDRRTKPKSIYGDYAHPEGSPADEDDCPPPIPPRISVPNQETKKEDWETEPTHMCLPALMNGLYHDNGSSNSASTRSKSLPRHSSLNDVSMDPSGPRRSKTAHLKNRVSQLFKTPRRKSCAFPDRPLPDVPANKAAVQRDNRRSQVQRPQSLYCPTDSRNPALPPPPARPCPQRPSTTSRQTPARQGHENMVVIEMGEGFPSKEELARCRGEFASSLRRISECGWYWGPMSWDDAEMRLENTPDGSFLVRDSSDDRHILSLTFRVQGSTHHTRIEHHNGKFSFWSQPTTHGSSSIVEFIEEAMRHSRNGRFLYFLRPRWPGLPPIPLQLLYPISRFQKARSLQHMCRFVIRRHVRLDHIDALPLPRRLKEYLREGQYYTPDDIKP
ncbi:uncharacterized protein [Diadema antillarum]|uniref:uncharacterized protein n=2 Tax=Diadema antillarum TaxID=105358 RepID=UPI003A889EBA